MALRRALKLGALTSADPGEAKARLLLDDGSRYEHPGRLLFSEAAVDATTGQVTLRGEFPNPDGDLLPGMYVRVLIEQGIQNNAIAVPQQAVQRDPSGRLAGLCGQGRQYGRVAQRYDGPRQRRSNAVIEKGLQPGEQVVVEGFQKLRPGARLPHSPGKRHGPRFARRQAGGHHRQRRQ